MLTIASLLKRKTLNLVINKPAAYERGLLVAFDGDEIYSSFPRETDLNLAIATVAYENDPTTENGRKLMEIESNLR